jgi:Ran GTPase-activating protein (RanGAP) involved in mRNA processing and transport
VSYPVGYIPFEILNNAKLLCFYIGSTTTTDLRIEEFIETIQSNSEINLDGKHLDTQDMEFICKAAIVDKQCRKLQLQNNSITAKGITLLTDTLHGNTTLVELNLSNNCISDMGAHALAQVLSINNETLARLEMNENNITDEGAEYLAEMLKTNKTLNLLGLNFNQISDRGVRHLASSITYYNETLQSLHLAFNKSITDASIDTLVDMLTHNRLLQELRLNDCSLTTDGKQKLKQIVQSNKHFILQV